MASTAGERACTLALRQRLYDRAALERIAHGETPLDFDQLYAVTRASDNQRLSDLDQPMQQLLPLEETHVLFVGYQASGTPGRAIQEAARRYRSSGETRAVRLAGEEIAVRAAVDTLWGLSAHADRAELKRWLDAWGGGGAAGGLQMRGKRAFRLPTRVSTPGDGRVTWVSSEVFDARQRLQFHGLPLAKVSVLESRRRSYGGSERQSLCTQPVCK